MHEKILEELEIREEIETTQPTALSKMTKIIKGILETWRLALSETPVNDHHLTLQGKRKKIIEGKHFASNFVFFLVDMLKMPLVYKYLCHDRQELAW